MSLLIAHIVVYGILGGVLVWIWTLSRTYVFTGTGDRRWWRDLRWWATVSIIGQIVIYSIF